MTADAKKAIFDSIRGSLAESRPFDVVRKAHHHESQEIEFSASMIVNETPKETLIENFRMNLEFVGGSFTAVFNEKEASAKLREIIAERKAETVAFSDSTLVGGIVRKIEDAATFVENADAGELFEVDLGVTGAQWAIAETGTLVLENDRERNRLTSLVPPVHVCIINASQLRQTLGEVLALLQQKQSRAITFITGPSRTSDIELTLAIGVHGPGELHVILIDE